MQSFDTVPLKHSLSLSNHLVHFGLSILIWTLRAAEQSSTYGWMDVITFHRYGVSQILLGAK